MTQIRVNIHYLRIMEQKVKPLESIETQKKHAIGVRKGVIGLEIVQKTKWTNEERKDTEVGHKVIDQVKGEFIVEQRVEVDTSAEEEVVEKEVKVLKENIKVIAKATVEAKFEVKGRGVQF